MSTSKYHGLINQGSTCYLNSVLQVLFMTKEFREAVERYPCDSKSLDFHLKDLFNELKSDTASTTKLTDVLGISKDFLQSDAAEWFENILSKMSNPDATELFQGIQTTKNKCTDCSIETKTEDPFWSLPLEMKDSFDNYDVLNGFENYFNESKLSGENQLYCEKCSTKSDTTMKVEMKHHPEVLTLLLKRFKFNYFFMKHVKVNRRVKIPEYLQIPPYGEMSPTYQLYAYVEHSGELKNGHYIVNIKDQNGEWYMFNDCRVFKTYCQPFSCKNHEMSFEAYLLFYRKISPTVADNNGTSTSGCSKSYIDKEPKEGQEGKEDHFVTNSDKPTEDRKLVEIDTSKSNVEMGNKQIQSDRRSTKDNDKHNKQDQDLDKKQYARAKLNESLPTGLHNENSVVSKSDTTKGNMKERQEQNKAAARAECSGVKEEGEINEKKNNKMDKQAKDQERIPCDKRYTKYDLVKPLVGVHNNPSKLHSDRKEDRKELNMTPQDCVDVCNRAEVNRSNKQAQSNRSEDDCESLKNLVDNNERPGRHDLQRTEMEVILNKPAENHKPPQKRKNSHSPEIDQHVEIRGESYKICEIMINGKNEKYILLKEICQASREDNGILDKCYKADCEIYKLFFDHIHVSEEPCTTPPGSKRKVTKMQTGVPSESYRGGSEKSQETRPVNQPGQIISAPSCPPDQNQMAIRIHSTANKPFENKDAGLEYNSLTSQWSRDTTRSLEVGGGAGGDLQQPLGPQCPGSSEGLASHFQGLTLNHSSDPNKTGHQRVRTKSGTFTGNQQFTDSDDRKNAISQSDTQPHVKTDETEKSSKDVCSNLFRPFYN
ncbi:ubiquitin carboxyl-terminal hydrolase 19-like [Poecilia reticulata]|uniref:ubiquitin carboxyl-terminal hydrolase 19-like n=1 Tax=Poecilia reticulata TaxID=8081 RepID=UPI0007E9C749|nr:PREDICTED: ubiquitin carboxyl-terminal hydrolase 19-like [Poecilia reticulata]